MRPLSNPGVVGHVWYNTDNYLFILLLNPSEPYRRFSIKTYNWRIYQTMVVMEVMTFTCKELATQEKSVQFFQFHHLSYLGS